MLWLEGRGPGVPRLRASILHVRVGVSGAELGYRCGWLCASMWGRGSLCVCVCVMCLRAGFVCVCLGLYVRSLGLALGISALSVCVFVCRPYAIFMHLFSWVCVCMA